MKNHFGRFVLVLLIVGLSAIAYFRKPPPLGLDLAGGSSLTYQAASAEGELTPEKLNTAIRVIESRLNAMGMAEISISPTQAGEIVIELPGRTAEQIKDIKSLVERNGNLEFRIQAESSVEMEQRKYKAGGLPPPPEYQWYPRKEGGGEVLVKTPEQPLKIELKRMRNRVVKELAKKGVTDEKSPEFATAIRQFEETEEFKALSRKYDEMVRDEVFKGEQLVRTDVVRQTVQLVVAFEFRDDRKPSFGRFTERHVGENMAIILDGKVSSAPVIKSKLPGEGIIEGGGAAGFNEKEARDLAVVLESGSTGIKLNLSREESLGPSLGEVAIERGMWSVIVGLVLVVLTIFYYYRLPGLVANFALLLNIVILMGVLAFFRAALTLPGIAGIVLTLGMAVDANVLIFERYREERHRGKSITESVAAGYDRAMSAIIDSNATTILTAIVLIIMGSGAVKGFGVTLTIGLLASMFTSVYVTHWIFDWAIEKGVVKDLVLGPDKKTPTFDYMRKRRWFTFPSSILMILGAFAYLARDDYDKRDLEFVGGQEAIIQLGAAISPAEADRRVKSDPRYSEASIVTLASEGVEAKAGATNRFRVRAKAATPRDGDEFIVHLNEAFKDVLVPASFSGVTIEPGRGAGAKAALTVHTIGDPGDPAEWKRALAAAGFSSPDAVKDPAAPSVIKLSVVDPASNPSPESVKARVGEAVKEIRPRVALSDPMPAKSFLEKSRAEELYLSAVWAVIVSLLIEIVYIRVRFADYSHGFAAVVAIIHDVAITLGAVAVGDWLGIVYAKVNLVLIAAFLTLIGYSMNDNMVVFDRIRETLGKRKVVNSTLVNDAINLTLVRSIRTSVTVFAVVLAQALFAFGTGSPLEGFAFVMVVGVIASTYSSIFIAAPLLLFLPVYLKKFTEKAWLTASMVVATLVGAIMMLTAPEPGTRLWIGSLLGFSIPIHFLLHFFPWLLHPDPDSFVQEEIDKENDERPLVKPGI